MNAAPTDARHHLHAGELEAIYLPGCGMLAASLRHAGDELLRPVHDLQAARDATGCGIPLLYPWANRLAAPQYAAAGKSVALDAASPCLRADANGLLNHGVRSRCLAWHVVDARVDRLAATMVWEGKERLAVFPYRHRLQIAIALSPRQLSVRLVVIAAEPTPISFGFHPNFCLPGPRANWRLRLPAMRRLELDARGIPEGPDAAFPASEAQLGAIDLDAAFAFTTDAEMSVAAGDRRIVVQPLEGFRYAQIYAPAAESLIAIEPMTAPTNALRSGRGLRVALPGQRFCASFNIRIETSSRERCIAPSLDAHET